MNARLSMIWWLQREANFWQNRSCIMVAVKVFHQNIQHVIVQKGKHVNWFTWFPVQKERWDNKR